MLAEGSSIRSTERITGVHRDTIMRLGVRVGEACTAIHNAKMRNIKNTEIQIDEIWGFIGKKKKQTKAWEEDVGDAWTFVALDRDSNLIPAFHVGKRTMIHAQAFFCETCPEDSPIESSFPQTGSRPIGRRSARCLATTRTLGKS